MLKNNTIPVSSGLSINLIPLLSPEVILETDQPVLNSQEPEEEDLADTYQRLPQFKLSERRSKFF